jgi:hypothetical protein
MANEIILLPSVVQNTLDGSAVDTQTVPMNSWPEKPTGTLTSRDQVSVVKIEASAGVQQLPEIEVFEHANFGGRSWRTNLNYTYVGDWWNDRISSIIIVRGRWRFYQHSNYNGAYWDLSGPAYYPWVEAANIPNDIISSFRFIGW